MATETTLTRPHIIELPKIPDQRGNLSFFQNDSPIPFTMERVYWIYDVPGGEQRGGHAYRTLQEFVVALSGSFEVLLSDGREEQRFLLNRSYYGLYIPPLYWRQMENFSTNSLALIVADKAFDEGDYVREFSRFQQLRDAR
ncbi:MAG: hypothetical protein JWP27_1046 [Flaviaesturariibacter sp.]|nr:hypothetical protein [Flaviaesturariibacter sp.]